jgi:hypothetical protein
LSELFDLKLLENNVHDSLSYEIKFIYTYRHGMCFRIIHFILISTSAHIIFDVSSGFYLWKKQFGDTSFLYCLILCNICTFISKKYQLQLNLLKQFGIQARGVSGHVSLSWLVLLTYKYMITHSPGLYS